MIALIVLSIFVLAFIAAIKFGAASPPIAMESINAPFKSLDYSDLPPSQTYPAADGTLLAYREYPAHTQANANGMAAEKGSGKGSNQGSVTLIHGSSANNKSMHPLAKSLAQAGFQVFALDMRGHGESSTLDSKGHIAYIGQLEDDLAAFVNTVARSQPPILLGFSAGAGFTLRFSAGPRQTMFGSYLLLSPFLGRKAPIQRPNTGGWASVGIPRIICLRLLNAIGITRWNHLAVIKFALTQEASQLLTPEYDYNLMMNFCPHDDYLADMRNARQPMAILAGTADEAFQTDQLPEVLKMAACEWPLQLLPGIGHIGITLESLALTAILTQILNLQKLSSQKPSN